FDTQNIVNKFFHFAAALADQTDHHDIGSSETRHHAHEHTLTHTTACKKSESLSAPHCDQCINCTNSHVQRFVYVMTLLRINFVRCEVEKFVAHQRALVIERLPNTVDHAAQ